MPRKPKKATPPPAAKQASLNDLPWNDYHPTCLLLYDALVLQEIPLLGAEMGPRQVYEKYCHLKEFAGMIEYNETFTRRLRDHAIVEH